MSSLSLRSSVTSSLFSGVSVDKIKLLLVPPFCCL